MAVTAKIDPIDRDVELLFAQELGPEARSKALANFAREQLTEAQKVNAEAAGGHVPAHETFVDGRRGATVETVKPDGTIVFAFDLVNDALEWIGEQLVKSSPVLTGAYARNHILLADGVEVTVPGPIPPAQRYVFVNVLPYARKIERGLSDQAPNGVYEVLAAVAKGRFGNVAKISFAFQSILDAPRGASKAQKEEAYETRQPAIVVVLR